MNRLTAKVVRLQQGLTNLDERRRRTAWPPVAQVVDDAGVGVVTVNFNTSALVRGLLFSLFRVLPAGAVRRVVVVDNGSRDDSLHFLRPLAEAGLVELLENRRRPYHGPGLNRGISRLAGSEKPPGVRYVWVLDSDVSVLRADALAAALEVMRSEGPAVLGQLQYDAPQLPSGYAHVSANLLDPVQVWRRGVPPFLEHGAPAVPMQRVLRRRGAAVRDFPFYRDGYLLHLGEGTLASLVTEGLTGNRYYGWASAHHGHHFHGNPEGPGLFARLRRRMDEEGAEAHPASFVEACRRPERVVL